MPDWEYYPSPCPRAGNLLSLSRARKQRVIRLKLPGSIRIPDKQNAALRQCSRCSRIA